MPPEMVSFSTQIYPDKLMTLLENLPNCMVQFPLNLNLRNIKINAARKQMKESILNAYMLAYIPITIVY